MTEATLRPPPEQELPPGRHDALRRQLLDEIAGRRPRSTSEPRTTRFRRQLMPLAAAAAVLIVIAGVIGVLIGSHRRPAPALNQPVVPGYSGTDLHTIIESCIDELRQAQRSSTSANPVATDLDLDGLRVYNIKADDAGTVALLYAADFSASCSWDAYLRHNWLRPEQPSGYRVQPQNPHWLPGAASIDAQLSRAGGDADPTSGFPGSRGYQQVGGRVPSAAARVEVTVDGTTVSVQPVNGTYLATLWFDSKYQPVNGATVIRTYDRAEALLGEYTSDSRGPKTCVVTPEGTRIAGPAPANGRTCTEAVRWQ